MKAFEDEVEKFGHLFLTSPDSTLLEEGQVRSLAGWVTLITILAQYIDRARIDITVTRHDLDCIWQRKVPPDHWSIFAASLDGFLWRARYRHRATNISPYAGVQEYLDAVTAGVQANTMVSSFGIGSIYFQVFGCPVPSFVSDYRAVTKQAGLNQLWPLPAGSLWPYAKQGTAKFPTKLVLTDATADELSNTYYERIRRLTKLSI
jgi:hypothetical protein